MARELAPKACLMFLDELLNDVDVVIKERLSPEFKKVIHKMENSTVYVAYAPSEME